MSESVEQQQHLRTFGEMLDALVVAIAEAAPGDSPFVRLKGEIQMFLAPHIAATVTCHTGDVDATQWALGFFGPPTRGVPGHSLSWDYGDIPPASGSPLIRLFSGATLERLARIWLKSRELRETKGATHERHHRTNRQHDRGARGGA